MKATPEQQQALLTLADDDERLRRLRHKRANLPEQVALDEHEEILRKVTDELIDATHKEERLAAETARLERQIGEAQTARKTHEAQMYSGRIQSEKELAALKEEIAQAKRRKSDLEDSLLETMEQAEEVDGLLTELRSRRDELQSQIADLTTRRDESAVDIDAEIADVEQGREAHAAALDDDVLGVYEDLRSKRGGRVVARLEGRTCSGCNLELTVLELEEIKETAQRGGLARCEQCGSIIVAA